MHLRLSSALWHCAAAVTFTHTHDRHRKLLINKLNYLYLSGA